jgi:hypothetical protein
MLDLGQRGWDDGEPGVAEARRKLEHLLAGDYLLYEVTGDRELRVLRLPARLIAHGGAAGRAFPTRAWEAPPAR